MKTITVPVVGVQFSDYKKLQKIPAIGDEVHLYHDRLNKFDPKAVTVFTQETRIGFLGKDTEAQLLAITGYVESACISKFDPTAKTHLMFEIELEVKDGEDLVTLC